MPVLAVLEGSFELTVGNASHIRNVPGRKTDVKDAEWIGDLLRHGLIRKSFVPRVRAPIVGTPQRSVAPTSTQVTPSNPCGKGRG